MSAVNNLELPETVLTGIFRGKITHRNDPKIVAPNAEANLPVGTAAMADSARTAAAGL